MKLKPIYEDEASLEVKTSYKKIREALKLQKVPLFFTYLGNYPKYLNFITDQLEINIIDPRFIKITESVGLETRRRLHKAVPISISLADWLVRNQYNPSFYNFTKILAKNFSTNMMLCYVFMSIREAVKGWAVSAPKLESDFSPDYSRHGDVGSQIEHTERDFVLDGELVYGNNLSQLNNDIQAYEKAPLESQDWLTKRDKNPIEKNLYVEYLQECFAEFKQIIKTEAYLYFRVVTEEAILMSIGMLPNSINSPVNEVYGLTEGEENVYDLLYLLSENFPTFAMQRMLFSGYMSI